jgi:multicomponent K+:H+ antiporter subunit E
MRRWIPLPRYSLLLAAMWLVLNETLAPAQVVVALVLGAGGGLLAARLQPPVSRVRLPIGTVVTLLGLMFADIVRSNIAVGRIAFHPRIGGRTAGFITLPLEVRHPGALAVLACIITATPGTSWARYDAARNELTIHVLDLVDEQAWIRQFKVRYERRLLEIFQ